MFHLGLGGFNDLDPGDQVRLMAWHRVRYGAPREEASNPQQLRAALHGAAARGSTRGRRG